MSLSSTATPHTKPRHRTWTRDGFLISTDPSLIDIPTLQRAFDSEDMYWAKSLPEADMRTMVDRSLCFGLYPPTPSPPSPPVSPSSASDGTAPPDPASTPLHEIAERVRQHQRRRQRLTTAPSHVGGGSSGSSSSSSSPSSAASPLIGFARGITDGVTFFYLTDVYVSSEWRGQGLGKWLVQCVQEAIEDMPHLRRSMLIVAQGNKENAEALYSRLMKMERFGHAAVPLNWKGPGCCF
ncbi:hypothetical protein PV08_06871 [Exophiala spinifera]|uniref:N-acetyltransferase domain-containing protein n=1 Tax=Exophiala spinifera TaxID=91928 RepID=A0A0D2B5Z4_9EURO|nr:uncharacterized protein PV08_06871 [Exophiala spinifera]KIW14090.1 hypothetical protein PV08_06871 [Exophiala spinifera]